MLIKIKKTCIITFLSMQKYTLKYFKNIETNKDVKKYDLLIDKNQ